MAGVNIDGVHVYEMINSSSGDNPEHKYGTVNENTEQTYNVVGSGENAINESIGEYHMYASVNENTEIHSNYVTSDENTLSGIHASQAQNGRANTCMKKEYKVVLIVSITLVVMAVGVAVPLVVFLPRKPQVFSVLTNICTQDSECSPVANSVCSGNSSKTCECKPGYKPTSDQLSCTIVNGVPGRTISKTLSVTNGDIYRDSVWGDVAFCPPGTFATGYMMKIQPDQGNSDDTSLNAIRLVCSDLGGVVRAQISSLEGDWGDLSPEEPCHNGNFLVNFKLQVEIFQGGNHSDDDSSVNYVKFYCRDFAGHNNKTELVRPPGYGLRGKWGAWSQTCDLYSAICGLMTRVETNQGDGDDTALNDVVFFCCNQFN